MKILRVLILLTLLFLLPSCTAFGAAPPYLVETEVTDEPETIAPPIPEEVVTDTVMDTVPEPAAEMETTAEAIPETMVDTTAEIAAVSAMETEMEPVPKIELEDERSGKTMVYLTFDDGPSAKNTGRILDILKEQDVQATFFTVGRYVDKYPELVARMHEEGHAIGCHSYTHDYAKAYESEESLTDEIAQWEQAVTDALGELPDERLFRFPGGSTACDKSMREIIAGLGYNGYDWNALNNDCLVTRRPNGMSEEDYLKQSLMDTMAYSLSLKNSPHIVLMHETYTQTADMLEWTIGYLRDLGCAFGRLDELDAGWYY
ncbi:MAG: polysaccharide deacetylase family protein [Clostridia bacterium]|nr:polysaccharide deacetylase family protein [Clostridia bacterium]